MQYRPLHIVRQECNAAPISAGRGNSQRPGNREARGVGFAGANLIVIPGRRTGSHRRRFFGSPPSARRFEIA
jgi:hypothetical protein